MELRRQLAQTGCYSHAALDTLELMASQPPALGHRGGGDLFPHTHGSSSSSNNIINANNNNNSNISNNSNNYSVPIPLPIYVRSRSPTGSDSFVRPKKCRRSRTVFTELQLMGLERKFESQKYLSTPDRLDLADTLGLSQIQVKTWYQNRRMKWKKQVLQKGGTESPTKPKGRPKKSSLDSPDVTGVTSTHSDVTEDVDVTEDMTSEDRCTDSEMYDVNSPLSLEGDNHKDSEHGDESENDIDCDDAIRDSMTLSSTGETES